MTATVSVSVNSNDVAVLVPTLTDAIQAALVYAQQSNADLKQVQTLLDTAQAYMLEAQNAADQATTAAILLQPGNIQQLLLTAFGQLPTSLPASSGVLWNNGGVISLS